MKMLDVNCNISIAIQSVNDGRMFLFAFFYFFSLCSYSSHFLANFQYCDESVLILATWKIDFGNNKSNGQQHMSPAWIMDWIYSENGLNIESRRKSEICKIKPHCKLQIEFKHITIVRDWIWYWMWIPIFSLNSFGSERENEKKNRTRRFCENAH